MIRRLGQQHLAVAGHLDSTWPDLRIWCRIMEYGQRLLRPDIDRLEAMAGIVAALEGIVTPGGFFFGLPEFFFDGNSLLGTSRRVILPRKERQQRSPLDLLGMEKWRTNMDLFWWRFSMGHNLLDRINIPEWDCEDRPSPSKVSHRFTSSILCFASSGTTAEPTDEGLGGIRGLCGDV